MDQMVELGIFKSKTLAPSPHPGPAAAGAGGVDQAHLTHRRSLRQQLLLALGFQGPVGLQGSAEVHHPIHAGLPVGVGAHHPIGERNPTEEDLSDPAWRWEATSAMSAGLVFAVA